jgi:hypothetical protein
MSPRRNLLLEICDEARPFLRKVLLHLAVSAITLAAEIWDEARPFLRKVLVHLAVSAFALAAYYAFELLLHVLPPIYYPWVGIVIKSVHSVGTIVALLILGGILIHDFWRRRM